MYLIPKQKNVFQHIEKQRLDDCYICFDPISGTNGAVFQFRCKHSVCVKCVTKANTQDRTTTDCISFSILSKCGVCRAEPNRYITESTKMCKVPYSDEQSIFVPIKMVTNNTLYRDHIQHMLAHSY